MGRMANPSVTDSMFSTSEDCIVMDVVVVIAVMAAGWGSHYSPGHEKRDIKSWAAKTAGNEKAFTKVNNIRSPAAFDAAYGLLGLIGADSVTIPTQVPYTSGVEICMYFSSQS